jgi:GNAT superfamily N-acetyltransferase
MAPSSLVLHNVPVIERVFDGLAQFCRLLGASSEGARTIERDGVLAAVVPAAPERAVANSVVYETADALEVAYGEIAGAYREIGANWTVWVRPGDDAAARVLESRGHVLDAQPVAMVHDLEGVERPAPDALPDWTREGDFAEVGPLNDRAYPFGTDSFTRVLQSPPAEGTHVYLARDNGRSIGCLVMVDREANSDVEMVAVVPEARGRGISGKLLGHALADAVERGLESATLVSTALGLPIYERAGFRSLGRASMWERRRDA